MQLRARGRACKGMDIKSYWESILRSYYGYMVWNAESGKPLPDTLRKLGLEDVIVDL
mgnify:CR=1 FL=1